MECDIIDILSSADFWKFTLPLLGAVVAWFANEWRKRIADQYQRKEANYKELLLSLRSFYVDGKNAEELKREFLDQLNIAWLYCPDDVIKIGYAFLDTVPKNSVHTQNETANAEKEQEKTKLALGAFVAAIRCDLLSRKLVRETKLSSTDFRHFS